MEGGAGEGIEGGVGDVKPRYTGHQMDSGIALVCISGGGDFDTIRGWCDTATQVRSTIPLILCQVLDVPSTTETRE